MKTETNLGIVAMSPKGQWNATTAYNRLNTVYDVNSSYVCVKDNTGQPLSSREYWQILVDGATVKAQGDAAEEKGNAAKNAAVTANEAAEAANTAALTIDAKIATKANQADLFDVDSKIIRQDVVDPRQGMAKAVIVDGGYDGVKQLNFEDTQLTYELYFYNGVKRGTTYSALLKHTGGFSRRQFYSWWRPKRKVD